MTLNQLKKLKKINTASFALWNPDHKKFNDTEYIKENIANLHAHVIILGLNPAREINFLENFHKGRYDHWYAEAFKKRPFREAYMTDLISHHESDAKKIISKWRKDKDFRNDNIKNLKKQFKILKTKNPIIACIGKNTYTEYNRFKKDLPVFSDLFFVKNPNGYRKKGGKNKFIRNVKKVGKKINIKKYEKYFKTDKK